MRLTKRQSFIKVLVAIAFLAALSGVKADNLTINWNNDATTLLRNGAGVALSSGAAATNSDGALIQLGYFSAGTTANNFTGTWIPITGATAAGRTTIGDTSDLSGAAAGVFQFNTFFDSGNTTNVDVYVNGLDSGYYQTHSSVPITLTTPPNNQVLSIRFYDNNTGSANYNTVSNDAWVWKTPDNTTVINIDLSGGGALEWESVSVFAMTGTEFRTVLIPEPSTFALLGAGMVGLVALRRRAKA